MTLLPGKDAAVRRMGDIEIYRELAVSLAGHLPDMERAMDVAIRTGAWEESRRLVHSFKGNCAAMGADALRETAAALERECAARNAEEARRLFGDLRRDFSALREELASV